MGATQHLVRDQATGATSWRHLGNRQALIPWWAALGKRHTRQINVGMLGDSYIEAYPVDQWGHSIGGWLRTLLNARFPVAGATLSKARGFNGVPSTAYMTTAPTNSAGSYNWAFTGGTHDEAQGFGAKFATWVATATGHKAVCTLPNPVTSFDIHHLKGASGGATGGYYAIDGGSHVAFATNNATNVIEKKNIPSPASTSIEVGWNASGGVLLTGITEYDHDETSQIAVHNFGLGGAQASTWLTHSTPAGWPQDIATFNLDLLIIQLGGNEFLHAVTSATFKTNLASLIAIIRAAGITCPIVLSMTVNATPLTGGGEPLQAFVTAARSVASADPSCMVVEHSPTVPATFETNTYGLFYTDNIHSAVDGSLYSIIANNLAAELSPQAA